ncbi:MAG: crosslink repair DNA glycosylase YcaQ family protein [Solirubrobacteraceae bacterium]
MRTSIGRLRRRWPRASGCSEAHDPYVAQPDRAQLVPDPAVDKQLFPPVGRPGVVLPDGVLTALWRGHKKGDALEVSVDWLGAPADITSEAIAIATFRDCTPARVV